MAAIVATLDRVAIAAGGTDETPVAMTVMSALAEGADRLIAGAVLARPDAELEAALPVARADYRRDFDDQASRAEFDELLGRAVEVTNLPVAPSREEAYQQAGRYVVERSDVLIAIWDGRPARGVGGTAEVVAYARQRGVPVVAIDPRGGIVLDETDAGVGGRARLELARYNRGSLPGGRFEAEIRRNTSARRAAAEAAGVAGARIDALSAWLWPYYVRADMLAGRHQRWYLRLGSGLFVLAATAVAAAAGQFLFMPESSLLVWLEVGLMVALLLGVVVGRRLQLHERWISYRFLAERLRSAYFLAIAGMGSWREGGLERLPLSKGPQDWLRRAFAEVWRRRPPDMPRDSEVAGVRDFLAEAWIREQEAYHRLSSRRNADRQRVTTAAITALFGATLIAAIGHALQIGRHEPAEGAANVLVFAAVVLPAIAAALGGIRAQREYHRHAERFAAMAHHLADVASRMAVAPDLETVRAVASAAEELMLEESRDWFVVVRFHNFELHV
ncbi:MAG TPA: hypothetical protein VEX41_08800 [Candidatus Eisenbacteria bacterium]|nr:hypothetical protein [Candidatus Eisenbacteria bacterium]